jgi:hypothetical protein
MVPIPATSVTSIISVKPVVAGVYALSEIHKVQTDFIRKSFVGKPIVVPDAMMKHYSQST